MMSRLLDMFRVDTVHFFVKYTLPFLSILLLTDILYAQNTEVRAYRIDSSVQIDGRLDEEAWIQADSATGFLQFEPNEGTPASQQTVVRVLYGEGSLYIGAMLYDSDPDDIERTLGRRDEYNRADWFLVSIDSYFNRQNAYSFGVNAAGIQYDALRSSGGGGGGPGGGGGGGGIPGMDTSWDAIWYSDVSVNGDGWIVEMQIPYSMLRFPNAEIQTWGIHFMRRVPRLGEESEWPLVPRSDRDNLVARFGYLSDVTNIEPRPNIQVTPYMVGRINTTESGTEPGERVSDGSYDVGGDVKIGLGPNITLDATINPDFGQVESDPAVLNLTAFESFFREQRPFFVEGIQIYNFSLGFGSLLYTRRIGAQSPIIGASKISGRTENGLSFGVLGAVTGDDFKAERNYSVARASQQIGDFSSAGGILTFYDSPVNSGGRRQSVTGGLDWDMRFADNQYDIHGFAAFTSRSLTEGGPSETGFAGQLQGQKRQGAWTGFAGVEFFGDEFNPNDLGQMRGNNQIAGVTRIEHQINGNRPFGSFQRANANAFIAQRFSYDEGLDLGLDIRMGSFWTLTTFQSVRANLNFQNIFGGYDLFETRGLGPWLESSSSQFQISYETDERRTWQVEPEVGATFYQDGGREYSLGLMSNWNAGSRLSFALSMEGEWERGITAWTANETFRRSGSNWLIGQRSTSPNNLGPQDFEMFDDEEMLDQLLADVEPYQPNDYYVPVFGARDTRSLDFTLRSTVTFTPNLSLQIYSQIFLARGRFDDFQIMQNRDDLASFNPYPKRDEFSLNSLNSNFVLRWEYRPGSTVFVVWSHARRAEDQLNPLAPFGNSPYDQSVGNQFSDTFDIFPDNTFLIKINYTFLY